MPWANTPADRARSTETYSDPAYQANRRTVLARAGGRCERCGKRATIQVDHVTPVSQGGTHALANLQALCTGPGSCHARKTAREGGGWRKRADPPPQQRTKWD